MCVCVCACVRGSQYCIIGGLCRLSWALRVGGHRGLIIIAPVYELWLSSCGSCVLQHVHNTMQYSEFLFTVFILRETLCVCVCVIHREFLQLLNFCNCVTSHS